MEYKCGGYTQWLSFVALTGISTQCFMLLLLFWLPVRINSLGLIPKFTCVVKSIVLMDKEMVKGGIWRLILCRLLVEHKIFTDN